MCQLARYAAHPSLSFFLLLFPSPLAYPPTLTSDGKRGRAECLVRPVRVVRKLVHALGRHEAHAKVANILDRAHCSQGHPCVARERKVVEEVPDVCRAVGPDEAGGAYNALGVRRRDDHHGWAKLLLDELVEVGDNAFSGVRMAGSDWVGVKGRS